MAKQNYEFENVIAPPIDQGAADATVSGKVFQDGKPASDQSVELQLENEDEQVKASAKATTDPCGNFSAVFPDTSGLPPGKYKVQINIGDTSTDLEPTLVVNQIPSADCGCTPCNDLTTTAQRALRDPKMAEGIGELLHEVAKDPPGWLGGKDAGKALGLISSAFSGRDAVKAVGPSCTAMLLCQFFLDDVTTESSELLDLEDLRLIQANLIDKNGDLVESVRSDSENGILFPAVTVGPDQTARVAFPSEFAEGAELLDEYRVTDPGGRVFNARCRNLTPQDPQKQKKAADAKDGENAAPANAKEGSADSSVLKKIVKAVEKFPEELINAVDHRQEAGENQKNPDEQENNRYFSAPLASGKRTIIRFHLRPAAAHVRCFSRLEGDSSCGSGQQYISRVAIAAQRDGVLVGCQPTGDAGCSGFNLPGGWYQFSAPEEIKIGGCNYTLCSASPVSAFLGARQTCSDIFFSYKKKGNEIYVVSQISSPDTTDPNQLVKVNFPGVTYLLVREDDLSFMQQQTTDAEGTPLSFQNLPAATYLIFPQAPLTYNGLPVGLEYPDQGRLALRVFGGQKNSKIPLKIRFRTGTTGPAVLQGVVRDNTGQPDPGQLVQARNGKGALVAAGVSNSTGFYSFPLYSLEDITLIVGAQQAPISKAQLQASATTVAAALPSPRLEMQPLLQAAELVGLNQ
ncbi:MAG TPA: carboxypeptidase-like regulatory domain-containing protein [Candidatus Binatia bacterium]|nr:carboxypeptidase-like regulatory domain-containing protein [Candidatus Binatia bacterium]